MDSQFVKFQGKCMYAKVYPGQECSPHPDAVTPQNKEDKHYEILVECSEDLFKKLRKAGIPAGTTLKEFEGDDVKYIKLKSTMKRGDWEFPPPVIADANGKAFDKLIGNGSKVVAIVELAPIKGRSGKVLRLKKVQVTEHVEYEKRVAEELTEQMDQDLNCSDDDLFN